MRNVQNVAASKTALIECPIGDRYHNIILQHGYAAGTNTVAGAAANVLEVRVKVNGRVQRVFSGAQLLDYNLLNGATYGSEGVPNTAPGVSFALYFAEPWRKDARDQDALAWVTRGWGSFQIEVDLSTASTPTLVAHAVVDDFAPERALGIVKVLRFSTAAGSTSFDFNLPDKRDFYQAFQIYPDSGGSNAPTKVTFRKSGVILHELTAAANKALLLNHEMTPAASGRTANIYDVVLDHDDLLGSAVPGDDARDLTLTIEAASAMSGTTTMLCQRLGPPE